MTEEKKTPKPALLLLPNLLGDIKHHEIFLPASVDSAVATLDGLIAENPTEGRRFLSRFKTKKSTHDMPIAVFNKDTPDADIDFLLEPIRKGERWGLISDAGLPCIADPGAKLVRRARGSGISIQAYVGPSSVTLALMLSGLSGQSFHFLGYLEREQSKREKQIKDLEKRSRVEHTTMIAIETPFRNQALLESLVATLDESTSLCVAWDLTLPTQGIVSQKVALWKKSPLPNLEKRVAIFLFDASI
jgi:16S rRNA (cytidine1402-2'-O)-methyltransferase